jgi:protein-disulfide isomerase
MPRFQLLSIALATVLLASANGSAASLAHSRSGAPSRDALTDAADRGRIAGKESAKLWFVMVSDFQCPFCKAWHDSTFRIIEREYVATGKIRMAFINFPLHNNSLPASLTAMCAAAQGKFWGTHDRIFDKQDAWKTLKDPRHYLDSLAVASGANPAELKSCEDGKQMQPLIEADQARYQKAGVGGTPTFFVGNATLVGALPPKTFRHVLDSILVAQAKSK